MSNHIKATKSNPTLVAASDHRGHGQGFVREQQLRADEGYARESLSGRAYSSPERGQWASRHSATCVLRQRQQ